jgi:hypothetical protein
VLAVGLENELVDELGTALEDVVLRTELHVDLYLQFRGGVCCCSVTTKAQLR